MYASRLLNVTLFALTLSLAACSTKPAPAAAISPVVVTLHSSGGIAGVMRVITLTGDGTLTLTDERHHTSTEHRVDSSVVTEIARMVENLPADQVRAPRPTCPDCMQQELVFERAGRTVSHVVPAQATADAADAQLLRRLNELAAGSK